MTSVLSQDSRTDLYRTITDKIVEAMKGDLRAYKMPWHSVGQPVGLPINISTYTPYRGINILSLWIEALAKQYPTGHWASYRQWQSLGAQVRKGERGSLIVFYKRIEQHGDAKSAEEAKPRTVFTSSYVFNAAQVEGWTPELTLPFAEFQIDHHLEAFVKAVGVKVRHGFRTPVYRRDLDDIEMPSPSWFVGTATSSSAQSYYAILLHELTHWTGASHRLDREFGRRFGDQAYAMEELVAELGAAFLCATFGIANEPRPDHAQYLASWLKVLEDDPRAIFTASTRAQEATQFLVDLSEANDGRASI